jgi:hypothetical protein
MRLGAMSLGAMGLGAFVCGFGNGSREYRETRNGDALGAVIAPRLEQGRGEQRRIKS